MAGRAELIAAGDLPAAAVTGCPDFLHPSFMGQARRTSKFLPTSTPPTSDEVRTDAGGLIGDRTQAPSGAGYALANRLVLSRAFPALYRDMNIERLAPFFQTRSGPRPDLGGAEAVQSAHLPFDAGTSFRRKCCSNRPISRATSVFFSSRAATSRCATATGPRARPNTREKRPNSRPTSSRSVRIFSATAALVLARWRSMAHSAAA